MNNGIENSIENAFSNKIETVGELPGVSYRLWKHPESSEKIGDPIVFIPGLGIKADSYPHLKRLYEMGHDVVLFDYSLEQVPASALEKEGFMTAISNEVAQMERMLPQLFPTARRIDIIAHSAGSAYALKLLALRADARAVLFNPIGLSRGRTGNDLVAGSLYDAWASTRHMTDTSSRNFTMNMFKDWMAHVGIHGSDVAKHLAAIAQVDLVAEVSTIPRSLERVSIYVSKADKIFPLEKMDPEINHYAQVAETDGTHNAPAYDAELVENAARWLREQES